MSKLSFRARALDPSKQMPIYLAEELPDLPEYSAINRAVPQMPSGMEKEEESEHHLQRAICTGLIIPTPEVFTTDQDFYDSSYPPNYKMPRQLIHMQPLGLDNDVPEYDMDSSDECWVKQQSQRLDLTPIKFEQMMDRLERSSGQTVVTLNEARALLKQDDEVSIAVYDYWLNKRLKTQHPLILAVKTENRPGVSSNNPYLAFRRRTEKMQTRKNRKNDETSYEKMLKLRRDLQRATTMLEMVKKREKTKKEQLRLSIEIFEKRVELRDFNGTLFNELCATLKSTRPAFAPLYSNQYSHTSSSTATTPTGGASVSTASGLGGSLAPNFLGGGCHNSSISSGNFYTTSQYLNSSTVGIDTNNSAGGTISRKEKRQYKKRKHKLQREKQKQPQQYSPGVSMNTSLEASCVGSAYSISSHSGLQNVHRNGSPVGNESNIETEEDEMTSGGSHPLSKFDSEYEEDTPFAFKRKQNCSYLKPVVNSGNWPWECKEENGIGELKYRFTLTSLRKPRPRCIGFARRRVGRGGRVILDRVSTDLDAIWAELDYTILESGHTSTLSNDSSKLSTTTPFVELPTVATLPTISRLKKEYDNFVPPEIKTINTNGNQHIKSENERSFEVRLALRKEVDIENSYVSELTIPKQKQRTLNCHSRYAEQSEEALTKKYKFGYNYNDETATNNLPQAHVFKISQVLKQSGISNIVSNGNIENDKSSFNCVDDETLTEKATQLIESHCINNVVLNNNNSNSNLNKNVSIGEKMNVIKSEAPQSVSDVTSSIKQELIDSASQGLAQELKEIQNKQQACSDICDDEDNVNLAQLSNLMRHTIKRELPDGVFTQERPPMHQIYDDVCVRKYKNNHKEDLSLNEENFGSLSPTSSLRLGACNDLLTEIRNDWLHFRPKTPSNELSDEEREDKTCFTIGDQHLVNWSQDTPISVEIVRMSKSKKDCNLWNTNNNDELFISNTFKYSEIEPDSGILKSVYPIDDICFKTKSTEVLSTPANTSIDLNVSGDSLNDINLLGDADETEENMLDNILQECQIDEIKTLNQATNFWNGILDGVAAVDEDGGDIESTETLLEGEARKNKEDRLNSKSKNDKMHLTDIKQGSTTFSVVPFLKINEEDFFKKKTLQVDCNTNNLKEELLAVKTTLPITVCPKLGNEIKKVIPESQNHNVNSNVNLKEPVENKTKIISPQHEVHQVQIRQVVNQNQQVQRQVLLQMQRDSSTTPVFTQYVTSSINNSTPTLRQPTLTPIRSTSNSSHVIYTTCSADIIPVNQKVAYIQKPSSIGSVQTSSAAASATNLTSNTLISLSNIKLENDGAQTATVISQPTVNSMVTIDGNSTAGGTQNINIISSSRGQQLAVHNISGINSSGSTVTSSAPLIVTTAGRNSHFTQQIQGHPSQQQIVWRQISAAPTTSATTALLTTNADSISANKIVWTSRTGQKRHINGPESSDINRLLLNRKLSQRKVISQQSQQIQISKQQLQQFQRDNDISTQTVQSCSAHDSTAETMPVTTQKVQMHGKVIKIPSFPLLVSELQQKQNSVTMASNHNYSLQASPIFTSQQVQTGNKIVLAGAGATTCSNFSGDMPTNVNSGQISINTTQKLHYKELNTTNSNMKVNFVSSTAGNNLTQGNLVVDTKAISGQQSSTVLLNKSTPSLQQPKLKPGSSIDNSKRVLYTSLLNVKNLQKTPSGQMQMQIGPGGMAHAVLRGRIASNQTIFTTNMRTVPIGTSISSSPSQTPNLGTIVSTSSTNTTIQASLSKTDVSNPIIPIEISKHAADQSNCNSNSSVSTASGNSKLGNNVIISTASTNNKNTIVTSTTNR